MKAYLFGSIFYEKDIEYNKILLKGIRQAWPGIDIYAPQEAPFNDKRTCADTKDIFIGDYNRLKETDLLIGCLDGDIPPIGSVTEAGIFCEMAQHDPSKHIVVLHTDTRDAYKTASQEKYYDLQDNQCHSQFNYFNLFTAGVIESCGVIVGTKEQLFEYVSELYNGYLRNNHYPGIYLITNRINNKQYIGYGKDVLDRLNNHRWVSTTNPQVIDQAIQKYGIENFTFEILEKCQEGELQEKEKYWCNEVFNCSTYTPNGYNVAPAGGAFACKGKIISSYTLNGKLIKTYPSILAAARELKCNPHAITQALDKNNRTCNDMLWNTSLEQECLPYEKLPHGDYKSVDVYDKDGNFINTYPSLSLAAQAHNVNLCRASACYNDPGHNKTNDLYFIPAGQELKINLNKIVKKIYCYDKRTRKYVDEFNSLKEAGDKLSIDPSSIGKVAKGQGYYCHNYIWSYLKYEQIPADYRNINQEYWDKINMTTK